MSESKIIKIFGCDNQDRAGDVIFVHGLDGDARKTWHPQEKSDDDNFWPAWLGEDLPNMGIWSLAYDVKSSQWKGNTMPLVDRATNILGLLSSRKIGSRPLFFITHSMGGLLVKQMLRHAIDYGNPKWKAIAQQTKLIVFLSTPHSGSNMANWIKYIGSILQTTVSVDELEAHHPRLRELAEVHRNHKVLSRIPIQVYSENQKTHGFMVVDQTSANPGIKGVTPIPIDGDHISICKLKDRESQIYLEFKNFVEEYFTPPRPKPSSKPKAESGDASASTQTITTNGPNSPATWYGDINQNN